MYGPNARSCKLDFWEELRGCAVEPSVNWVIYGDFNAIFALKDKASSVPKLEDIRQARNFLYDFGLWESSSVGRRFTWMNGQVDPIWVKLDQFLINNAWVDHFPRMIQNFLPRLGSDHMPICLEAATTRPYHDSSNLN